MGHRITFYQAGQESFRSITKGYYRGSIGALVVYDVTNKSSFDNISHWFDDLKSLTDNKIVITLVGNKTDLASERKVSHEEGSELAKKMNSIFIEASAKDDVNVEEVGVLLVFYGNGNGGVQEDREQGV